MNKTDFITKYDIKMTILENIFKEVDSQGYGVMLEFFSCKVERNAKEIIIDYPRCLLPLTTKTPTINNIIQYLKGRDEMEVLFPEDEIKNEIYKLF